MQSLVIQRHCAANVRGIWQCAAQWVDFGHARAWWGNHGSSKGAAIHFCGSSIMAKAHTLFNRLGCRSRSKEAVQQLCVP